jgi:hypothetical protein
MSEQSQKAEMNAAIRAHRKRQNVPRSIAPEPPGPPAAPVRASTPEPEPEHPKSLLRRLFRK